MRKLLDTLYKTGGGIAALSILGICLLVTAQVSLNILARIGGPQWSFTIPSYADFAGFLLSTASFMALAYTLRAGAHIRVNLLVQHLPLRARWIAEMAALALAAAMTGYATWFTLGLVGQSYKFADMSTGMIAVPIWIPQTAMVAGLGLLTIALIDTLVQAVRHRAPVLIDTGTE